MATRIIEFAEPDVLFPVLPRKVVEQPALTATSSAQNSLQFSSATRIVMVQSDEAISVSMIGDATANSYRLAAAKEQIWWVQPGQTVSIKL